MTRRPSPFPARLIIHGPCCCQPYRMSLVVTDQWIPFIRMLAAGRSIPSPYRLVVDISHMSHRPTTE